jgi:hypothetical protein
MKLWHIVAGRVLLAAAIALVALLVDAAILDRELADALLGVLRLLGDRLSVLFSNSPVTL